MTTIAGVVAPLLACAMTVTAASGEEAVDLRGWSLLRYTNDNPEAGTPVDLGGLARDVATQVESLVDQGGNVLRVVTPAQPVEALTDPTLVRQGLLNLLSNACKFTENGAIRLNVDTETAAGRDWVTLEVSDTGMGMSAEDVASVFDEFYRADRSRLGHKEGTGLGLAITKKMCHLLGGDVAVESRLGEGSTFTIRLPRGEAEGPQVTTGSRAAPELAVPLSS